MRKQTKIWRTKDGKKIRICDMDDNHLLNTIKFIERTTTNIHNAKLLWMYSQTALGDMASMALDNEITQMEEDGPDPYENTYYQNLLDEKDRRGL